MPVRIPGILKFTGWREPISISGAGKVVDGILRRRPCFLPAWRWPQRPPADVEHYRADDGRDIRAAVYFQPWRPNEAGEGSRQASCAVPDDARLSRSPIRRD